MAEDMHRKKSILLLLLLLKYIPNMLHLHFGSYAYLELERRLRRRNLFLLIIDIINKVIKMLTG